MNGGKEKKWGKRGKNIEDDGNILLDIAFMMKSKYWLLLLFFHLHFSSAIHW